MLIALDFDETYTRDKSMWRTFIQMARLRGHEVVCVTMREPRHGADIPCEVVFTSGAKKRKHMESLGRHPDIWIDDWPEMI